MLKNKNINQEKGSVSVYVIATVFCFLIILGIVFFSSSSVRKNQLNTLMKIKQIYSKQMEQASQISEKRDEADTSGYVQTGLVVFFDSINNMGSSHSNNTTVWRDLSGNGNDAIYKGTGKVTWNENAYDFSTPQTNYFETKNIISLGTTSRTIEIVCSIEEDGVKNLAGFGTTTSNAMYDLVYNNSGINVNVSGNSVTEGIANSVVTLGKPYATSITYDASTKKASYRTNTSTKNSVTFNTLSTGNTTLTLGIGKNTNATYKTNKRFKIQSLRIYNRVLTDSERAQNYGQDQSRYGIV